MLNPKQGGGYEEKNSRKAAEIGAMSAEGAAPFSCTSDGVNKRPRRVPGDINVSETEFQAQQAMMTEHSQEFEMPALMSVTDSGSGSEEEKD